MGNSMLYHLPFDPMYLVLGCAGLSLVLLVAFIICLIQMRKLYRRYDRFMRGKDAETLEDTLMEIKDELTELYIKDHTTKDMLKAQTKQVKDSFQKFGLVKYNAFKGMGGNLSFVLAMLDDNNTGFILDAVHSREGCYLYLKEVEEGATEVLLGSEEQEALEQALGYVKRPTMSERLDQNKKSGRKTRARMGRDDSDGRDEISDRNSVRAVRRRAEEDAASKYDGEEILDDIGEYARVIETKARDYEDDYEDHEDYELMKDGRE